MNDTIDISLEQLNINAFESALEPAIALDNKITLNIDLNQKNAIYGVSGGHDKYKFWSTKISDICNNITTPDSFDNAYITKAVVLNTKHLLGVIRTIKDNVTLTLHTVFKRTSGAYETIAFTISTNDINVRYACASIAVGQDTMSDEDKAIKLGEYGDTYAFDLDAKLLLKLKQLSGMQTLATPIDYIKFANNNGHLKIYNEIFDFNFSDITVGDMPEFTFKTYILHFIDNDNYTVSITNNPQGVKKIMFLSKDRDIQFICSFLVSADSMNDVESIESEFASFTGK